MAARHIGSAVVHDPERPGPGIITERDIMLSLGAGESPDEELVEAHMASDVIFASPDWSLDDAAEAMVHPRLSAPGRRQRRRTGRHAVDARSRALLRRDCFGRGERRRPGGSSKRVSGRSVARRARELRHGSSRKSPRP